MELILHTLNLTFEVVSLVFQILKLELQVYNFFQIVGALEHYVLYYPNYLHCDHRLDHEDIQKQVS